MISIRNDRLDFGATGLLLVKMKAWGYFKSPIPFLQTRIFPGTSEAI
jgi:hypothetical protein